MLNFFKNIFRKTIDFKELVENGAQVIDVRTPAEFSNGNIRISRNIPLQELKQKLEFLDKEKPVITICASGMRSESAKTILESNGFSKVYNGGGWKDFQEKIYE